MWRFLAVLRSFFRSSLLCTFSCHPSAPSILPSSLSLSSHLFLGLPLSLVVPKFIYNTLSGILFPSILCTCPNQRNWYYNNTVYILMRLVSRTLCIKTVIGIIHSFIPMACAECDDSLPFSGASSVPLCYVLFPATLLHQLFFHPLSPHLAIYFLVCLSILLFPKSYIIPFWGI